MSDYIIGDVQGCFDALQELLKKINFSIDKDRLFFLGDIVNRGDKSLETLRFIMALKDNAKMVLGNHDFHLLACMLYARQLNSKDTFYDVINAVDKNKFIDFLLLQPLMIEYKNTIMVHAGVPPNWGKELLIKQSSIVQKYLQSDNVQKFLASMYSSKPTSWSADLSALDSARYTINALMRMRFCDKNGTLELSSKMNYIKAPKGYKAWFLHFNRVLSDTTIFFGHWSSLKNISIVNIYPLDYGYIWGGALAAIRFDDKVIFTVKQRR